jgi:hypothetical protein
MLVYGLVYDMSRSNIVLWAKGALEKGENINVVNDQFRCPTLAEDLAEGEYRLRLAVHALNGNYIQDPLETRFFVGTNEVTELAVISIDEPRGMDGGSVTVFDRTPIIGTVRLADSDGYYKLEIIDADELKEEQQPRFFEWTTLGDIQQQGIENGLIGEIPGIFSVQSGNYRLRIVVVNGAGQESARREFNLNIDG